MYYRSQIKYLKIYYNFQHLSSKSFTHNQAADQDINIYNYMERNKSLDQCCFLTECLTTGGHWIIVVIGIGLHPIHFV